MTMRVWLSVRRTYCPARKLQSLENLENAPRWWVVNDSAATLVTVMMETIRVSTVLQLPISSALVGTLRLTCKRYLQ